MLHFCAILDEGQRTVAQSLCTLDSCCSALGIAFSVFVLENVSPQRHIPLAAFPSSNVNFKALNPKHESPEG